MSENVDEKSQDAPENGAPIGWAVFTGNSKCAMYVQSDEEAARELASYVEGAWVVPLYTHAEIRKAWCG